MISKAVRCIQCFCIKVKTLVVGFGARKAPRNKVMSKVTPAER